MRVERQCPHCGYWNDGLDCEGETCAECAAGRVVCHGCVREIEPERTRPAFDWFLVVFVVVVLLALLA